MANISLIRVLWVDYRDEKAFVELRLSRSEVKTEGLSQP